MQTCRIDKNNLRDQDDWEVILAYLEEQNKKYKVKGRAHRHLLVKLDSEERKMVYDKFGVYWDVTF